MPRGRTNYQLPRLLREAQILLFKHHSEGTRLQMMHRTTSRASKARATRATSYDTLRSASHKSDCIRTGAREILHRRVRRHARRKLLAWLGLLRLLHGLQLVSACCVHHCRMTAAVMHLNRLILGRTSHKIATELSTLILRLFPRLRDHRPLTVTIHATITATVTLHSARGSDAARTM